MKSDDVIRWGYVLGAGFGVQPFYDGPFINEVALIIVAIVVADVIGGLVTAPIRRRREQRELWRRD